MKETKYLENVEEQENIIYHGCEAPKDNVLRLTTYNGIAVYKQTSGPSTAYTQADGCSIPGFLTVLGLSKEVREFFRPAYQEYCDYLLGEKMDKMCKDAYYPDGAWDIIVGFLFGSEYESCMLKSLEIYSGLRLFGFVAYNEKKNKFNTSSNCSFCGNQALKNKFQFQNIFGLIKSNIIYNIQGFLKNDLIPIPLKRTLFSAKAIGQVSYYPSLLGSNKTFCWILDFSKPNSFVSIYCISKELNIPPLFFFGKCALAQVRYFNKWEEMDLGQKRKILNYKLNNTSSSSKEIMDFY
ncbi:hypothetical protein BCR32DRAFT_280708 [Anaeromyces robustus]|uniref:Uncharacterized protein n=1 Tax=Anaeromyces robustus TaxID=1754192 RepID=A0A1Y1X356_9FUNG|nr:hypothetical protein BCR32DRAFT_280708 [Anaeromyces robustus]|eukprot:ORX80239.1 hypothetical protein BCR32DRAFT_280708 [Anaeromyces robustus]